MAQLLTRGIRVSVEVFFEGTYFKDYKLNYSYAYQVTIHNQEKNLFNSNRDIGKLLIPFVQKP